MFPVYTRQAGAAHRLPDRAFPSSVPGCSSSTLRLTPLGRVSAKQASLAMHCCSHARLQWHAQRTSNHSMSAAMQCAAEASDFLPQPAEHRAMHRGWNPEACASSCSCSRSRSSSLWSTCSRSVVCHAIKRGSAKATGPRTVYVCSECGHEHAKYQGGWLSAVLCSCLCQILSWLRRSLYAK